MGLRLSVFATLRPLRFAAKSKASFFDCPVAAWIPELCSRLPSPARYEVPVRPRPGATEVIGRRIIAKNVVNAHPESVVYRDLSFVQDTT